jgi:hypothetical protein
MMVEHGRWSTEDHGTGSFYCVRRNQLRPNPYLGLTCYKQFDIGLEKDSSQGSGKEKKAPRGLRLLAGSPRWTDRASNAAIEWHE